MIRRKDVLAIIDEVMFDGDIDSFRAAIIAIRNKIIDMPDYNGDPDFAEEHEITVNQEMLQIDNPLTIVRIALRGEEMNCSDPYFEGAEYFCVCTGEKIDSRVYGSYWYE